MGGGAETGSGPPSEAAVAVVRPVRVYGPGSSGGPWGPVVIAALGEVTGLPGDRLAAAAGCPASLVDDISACLLRPACETLERIANGVGLEVRVGVRRVVGASAVQDRFDCDYGRVREALAAENSWRAGVGLGPLAPPPAVVPGWDGTDPAPARQVCAWPHRTDYGGHAAVNVRYGRNCVLRLDEAPFAARVGLTLAELDDIESGRVALSLDDTESLLNSAGLEQFARLEPYDDHDDLLHLAAIAERPGARSRLARVGS